MLRPGPRRLGRTDNRLGKIPGGAQRTGTDNRAGDPARITIFPAVPEKLPELRLRQAID
jgi:hypothetical protein